MRKTVTALMSLGLICAVNAVAGGDLVEPVEPKVTIPKKEIVVVDDVKYDGFYLGLGYSGLRMNERELATGHAATLIAGYYFGKFFGLEARYTRTIGDVTYDNGPNVYKRGDSMSNLALYAKPIYNITPGLAVYALAGYGKSVYKKGGVEYSDQGGQWGLGAKYELANGLGFFVDYVSLYDSDVFDETILAQDLLFDALSIGSTYTF